MPLEAEQPDRLTVLIADDEPPLRLLMRATIGREHFRVLEASDGGAALELARRERPAVALLDVGMPCLDGYEVCRALKADPATASIVVIMVTARGQQADREQGIAAGADAYLTKPFRPREILDRLYTVLEGRVVGGRA